MQDESASSIDGNIESKESERLSQQKEEADSEPIHESHSEEPTTDNSNVIEQLESGVAPTVDKLHLVSDSQESQEKQ